MIYDPSVLDSLHYSNVESLFPVSVSPSHAVSTRPRIRGTPAYQYQRKLFLITIISLWINSSNSEQTKLSLRVSVSLGSLKNDSQPSSMLDNYRPVSCLVWFLFLSSFSISHLTYYLSLYAYIYLSVHLN